MLKKLRMSSPAPAALHTHTYTHTHTHTHTQTHTNTHMNVCPAILFVCSESWADALTPPCCGCCSWRQTRAQAASCRSFTRSLARPCSLSVPTRPLAHPRARAHARMLRLLILLLPLSTVCLAGSLVMYDVRHPFEGFMCCLCVCARPCVCVCILSYVCRMRHP